MKVDLPVPFLQKKLSSVSVSVETGKNSTEYVCSVLRGNGHTVCESSSSCAKAEGGTPLCLVQTHTDCDGLPNEQKDIDYFVSCTVYVHLLTGSSRP